MRVHPVHLQPLLVALCSRTLVPCVGPALRRAAGLLDVSATTAACAAELALNPASLVGTPSQQYARLEQLAAASGRHHRLVRWHDDPMTPIPAVARALVQLSFGLNYVVTTNVDRILERAFSGNWPSLPATALLREMHTGVIVKACGSPRDAGEARRRGLKRLLAASTV